MYLVYSEYLLQGYFAHEKMPTPYDPPRTLSIGLQQGPRGSLLLMSEVTLYGGGVDSHQGDTAALQQMHLPYSRGSS